MTMNTLELEQELPRRERRKLVTTTATIAAAITLAALGFAAGVEVQKSQGAEASPGRMAFPGAGGGFPGAGSQDAQQGTAGEVTSVDGSTLYVQDASGNTLKVRAGKGADITRTAGAKAAAIHPGDTVVVQGETASSGTVVATSIQATASSAGP